MKTVSCFRSVDEWKASLMKLPDQNFFELLRSVFGNIKTPFNKQRLMDDVFSFLSKEDIRKTIAAYIDEKDHLVIAAVSMLKNPQAADLESFFSGELSYGELHALMRNMEERFILYRFDDSEGRRLALNPTLESILTPFASDRALLFPSVPAKSKPGKDDASGANGIFSSSAFSSDNRIIAYLFSFIEKEKIFFKTEGGIRKKTLDEGKRLFPDLDLELVSSLLERLGLFLPKEEAFVPDNRRIEDYCALAPAERQEYWAAALYLHLAEGRGSVKAPSSWENFNYSRLKEIASFVHGFIALLDPARRYPKTTLRRFACLLVSEDSGSDPWGRRLFGGSTEIHFVTLLEAVEKCGLLTAEDELYRIAGQSPARAKGKNEKGVIAMDSAFGFILYPDIELADALAIASFCSAKDGGGFELSASSAIRGFDKGLSSGFIIELLKRLSGGMLDSNLEWTLKDWESRYVSVALYRGEIMVLAEDRRYLAEVHPLVSIIKKTLAPGVYLLSSDSRHEITRTLEKAGVDIFSQTESVPKGQVAAVAGLSARDNKTGRFQANLFPFTKKNISELPLSAEAEPKAAKHKKGSGETPAALKKRFTERLKSLKLTDAEREELNARIERRLVLTETQLDTSSLKYEKLEARGLDYTGKTNLARQAITSGSLVEVSWQDSEGKDLVFSGIPSALEKREGDNLVLVLKSDETEGGELRLPLRKISRLRKIKQSIFEG